MWDRNRRNMLGTVDDMPQYRKYMTQALELAHKGAGWVNPNPLVGTVVVRDGEILAAGYHDRYRGPHAERMAFDYADEHGVDMHGATVIDTLEPCCHVGSQPACTDLILSHGITRVVVGSIDPNFGMPSKMRWLFGDGNIFGNASSAIAVLVFVSLWQFTPFHALLYQGAVRAIPKTLYEAASIDGAGRIRQFFCITIPQVRNTLITSLLFQVVGGLTAFDAILVLTKGGPGTDTQNTAYYMYSTAFKAYNYGYSSVIAVVLIVIATILSLVMVKVSGYDKMRSELEGI